MSSERSMKAMTTRYLSRSGIKAETPSEVKSSSRRQMVRGDRTIVQKPSRFSLQDVAALGTGFNRCYRDGCPSVGLAPTAARGETMGDIDKTISRREALKTTAKVAGAAAFAAPVIAGVFSAPAAHAVFSNCDPLTNSYAKKATNITGNEWNTNGAAGYPFGRYNGQNRNFNLQGLQGTISLGGQGVDNFDVRTSYYYINLTGYNCEATFRVENCGPNNDQNGEVDYSQPSVSGIGYGPLPFCSDEYPGAYPNSPAPPPVIPADQDYTDANAQLVLVSIYCCPV